MKHHIKKTGQITKKIIHIKITLLVLMLLPLAVFTLLTSKFSFIAGIRSMVVLSGSMEPKIPTGSVVYIQPSNKYSIDDVVTFTTDEGMTVTHRIVDSNTTENGLQFVTKGDANSSVDSQFVTQSQIMGKSIFSLPYLGYVVNFLKTPKGFLFAIIIPTIVFIGLELWAIKKEIEKSVEKRVMERMAKQSI